MEIKNFASKELNGNLMQTKINHIKKQKQKAEGGWQKNYTGICKYSEEKKSQM